MAGIICPPLEGIDVTNLPEIGDKIVINKRLDININELSGQVAHKNRQVKKMA